MKNRIIDYFILFVGGCLIFTVMGGMVVGLLKLIQITADEPFPNQSGVDSNYWSSSTSPILTATLSLSSADGSAPLVERAGPTTRSTLSSQKPSPATMTTLFRPSWGTRNEFLR